jgi:CubicO group peptidase (beta-lactamase class C family)
MLAAAVQDGLVGSLDEPVAKTLAEWRGDPRKTRATIRDLLTLSAGLRGRAGRPPEYRAAVAQPLVSEPGEVFSYGPASYQVWGEVMKRKLAAAGQPADPYLYLKRRVLDPIGLSDIGWRRTPDGDPLLPQGAVMTAREWARFGEFVRGDGKVGGRAIIDPATFHELFRSSRANPAYGITWWLPHPPKTRDLVDRQSDLADHLGEVPPDLVMAAGAGDQRLYVIPSRHLTIVRLATLKPGEACWIGFPARPGRTRRS